MVDEVEEAARLIDAHLAEAGPGREPMARLAGSRAGMGRVAARRGARVGIARADGRIDRARLRPASVRNWRAFDDAARAQNVFTDIPIIEASFWLTVAGFAR